MKPLKEQIEELQSKGYSAVLASAKVVHDVVLMAISRSGFKVNGTLSTPGLDLVIRGRVIDLKHEDYLRHALEPKSGYSLDLYRTMTADNGETRTHLLITTTEAEGLRAAILGSMPAICFGA